MRYEIDIFHYIDIYKRHLKGMVFLIIIAMLVTLMFQSMQPTIYRSTLIALSSKESSDTARWGGINLTIGSSSDNAVLSILKSRTMKEDVNKNFNLKNRPKFWWTLDTYSVTGGFAIEVTGSDAEMTERIANYAADHVNEINKVKNLIPTTTPRMINVLDAATKGTPIRQDVSKKTIASGLFVFLFYTLFVFFREYFSHLKKLRG